MKKFLAMLVALCMLSAAVALADAIPSFDEMPLVVMEDEDTVIEEGDFEGEWVIDKAFYSTVYVDLEEVAAEYGLNLDPIYIADGMVTMDTTDENGEAQTEEIPYIFKAGQLQCTDEDGNNFVVELLEDGNIVMSMFVPGEEDAMVCISLFMVPAE